LRPQPRVAAIVLAAGCSTRMGEQKVLLPLQGRTLVEWVADAALGSIADETIVVVGREAESVRRALGDRAITMVANPDPARGMSTSLQAGVRAAAPGCDAAVFLLGDQPFVTSALVDRLVDRFAETGKWIIRPRVGDRSVHPVLMSAALFSEILDERGDVGGREIARRHPEQLCLVPVDDPRVELDIDTGEDYEMALRIGGEAAEGTRETE
jgi:molybdenum cofactor cytidylyltransferase